MGADYQETNHTNRNLELLKSYLLDLQGKERLKV